MLSRVDQMQEARHYLVHRHGRLNLVTGCPAQERLYRHHVVKEPTTFFGVLAVRVVDPRGQPVDQSLDRRAEEDDVVELRMELHLVLLAPGEEQNLRVLCIQQGLDGVLAPQLTPVRLRLAPSVIGVDSLEPAGNQLLDDARFPGPRHARDEDALHVWQRTRPDVWSEPTVGAEGAQGPEGFDPAPLLGGGDPRWFPGKGPATVGLLVAAQAVQVALDDGVVEQPSPGALG